MKAFFHPLEFRGRRPSFASVKPIPSRRCHIVLTKPLKVWNRKPSRFGDASDKHPESEERRPKMPCIVLCVTHGLNFTRWFFVNQLVNGQAKKHGP